MPSYNEQRQVAALDLAAHGSAADNSALGAAFILPAGKTAQIFGVEAYIVTGSGASDTIEIVASDATSTVLAEIDINTTGVNKDSSTTFPVRVANTGSTDKAIIFQANGLLGSPVGQVFVQYSNPGVA